MPVLLIRDNNICTCLYVVHLGDNLWSQHRCFTMTYLSLCLLHCLCTMCVVLYLKKYPTHYCTDTSCRKIKIGAAFKSLHRRLLSSDCVQSYCPCSDLRCFLYGPLLLPWFIGEVTATRRPLGKGRGTLKQDRFTVFSEVSSHYNGPISLQVFLSTGNSMLLPAAPR